MSDYYGSLAMATLAQAQSDLGKGEVGGNNKGSYVWSLTGRKTSGAWCAAAVYSWIKRGAQSIWMPCPIPRSNGAKRLCRYIREYGGRMTDDPAPGDIVLWDRGRLPWQGHVGVVSAAYMHTFRSIEGNVGRYPALVREFRHDFEDPKLIGFYRLP